ncbi:MFS transporter [Arvimicrobium flavum]|uniref:MFS transporter n=1 Tax=Arvimicrobium flavum TaxID=3393320 RepID=UPI00237BC5C5|nr:MFS transporter [Mesorhizobium shangrilense]
MAGIVALAFGYVLSQFFRSFLAVLTPALSADIGASKADLALASGAYFLVFALAQFAVGVSLDRLGPRRTVSLFLAFGGGGGSFLFAAASEPWMVIAAMGLIGLGCAPVLMASLFIFAKAYSPARFAVLASWMVAFGTAGNVLGAAPLANAAELIGWRPVMTGLGVVTLLTAAALARLVSDPETDAVQGAGLSGYRELFRMRVLWPIIPLVALNYAPASGIRGLWAGPYLADVYGADALLIGNVTFVMALAMVAGSFVYGPLDTIFRSRKWVAMAGCCVLLCALAYLAIHPAPELAGVTALLVVIGVSGGAYGLLMAHARAFFPPHLIGRGVTLMNFFSIGGAGAMQFATGMVVTRNIAPGDPTAGYQALFAFYAAMLGLALFAYLLARDAKPEAAPSRPSSSPS